MIFIINNNTTHNYSRYSTGPSRIYSAPLNVKCALQTMINNAATFENNQNNQPYLFQTKQLLCWGPDIAFFNLRNTFSNIFKALQICWSAARNNKKILFINGKDSIAADSILVNAWLMHQYKRHSMPRKLNNISNYGSRYRSHLPTTSKYSITTAYENKGLFNHLTTFLNSCYIKVPQIPSTKVRSFIKNSNSLLNCILTKSKDFYMHNCSQLGHMQSNNYAHEQKTKRDELAKTRKLNTQKASKIIHSDHSTMLSKSLFLTHNEKQSPVSNYDQFKINTNNAIRLQVKEAHILTQQITGEITVPLVGFLTNTKTGFNTLQNQRNDAFFNQSKSVYLNNSLNALVKNTVHTRAKALNFESGLHHNITNHNYEASINKLQSSYSASIYHQYYLPFSFYVRPVNNGGLLVNQQSKQKQCIIRQNIFGKILAWRLKGQYPSSMFYSQFKIFDQRHKYKIKQLTIPNNNNVDAAVYELKLTPAKSQVLFKNSKNFITLKKPVRLVQRTYKTSLQFYSNSKPHNTSSDNQPPIKLSPADTGLACSKNTRNLKVLLKSFKDNSINNYYISRFYQSIKTSSMYNNQHKNSISPTKLKSPVTQLFRTNYVLKAYKTQTKQLIAKLLRYDEKKFCNYYDKLINSNQLNQYQMFAKSPYVNNKLADIIFFINPEKNQNLVNQANCLKIPTIGIISGMAYSELGRRGCNHYNLNNLVNYPILGNPSSHFFVYTLIGVFIKALSSS